MDDIAIDFPRRFGYTVSAREIRSSPHETPERQEAHAVEKEEGFFVDITDEEGNNFKLEIVGEVEYEDALYRVFLPTDIEEDDPDYGFIILKCTEVDGEEMLDSVDDEELLEKVYAVFMEELFNEEDEEE